MRFQVGDKVIYMGDIREITGIEAGLYWLKEDRSLASYKRTAAHVLAFDHEVYPLNQGNKSNKHVLARYDN